MSSAFLQLVQLVKKKEEMFMIEWQNTATSLESE